MISTHVLDTANGEAGYGVNVSLYKLSDTKEWEFINKGTTGPDGRCASFITEDRFTKGTYKFIFQIGDYFKSKQQNSIFPTIDIIIECETGQHYHIPVLVSNYSYTTYKGK